MFDFNEKPIVSTPELTKEMGMNIYKSLIEQHGIMEVISLGLYEISHILIIGEEVDRILQARGQKELTVDATYDEDGNIITEAVYEDIIITSDILDVNTILTDFPLEVN